MNRPHWLRFLDLEVIGEDQGTSGDDFPRTGIDRLVSAVCRGTDRLVLSLAASRLARDGRELQILLNFCTIVGCLVGDRSRLSDPAVSEDRLLLGAQDHQSEILSIAEHWFWRRHSSRCADTNNRTSC